MVSNVVVSSTAPADTSVLWLSTSLQDQVVPQGVGQRVPIITPSLSWEGNVCQEPKPFYLNGCYHLIYTMGGFSNPVPSIGYAQALNMLGPWTKNPNPVLGRTYGGVTASAQHASIYIEGSTVYLYWNDSTNNVQCLVATAPTSGFGPGLVPTFTAQSTPPLALPTGFPMGNRYVIKDTSFGSTPYVMMVEGNFTNWKSGYALAASPLGPFALTSWPVSTLYPPYLNYKGTITASSTRLDKEGNTYVLHYHAGPDGLPTEGFRATSADLVNWTVANRGQPLIRKLHPLEVDQVADLGLVQGPGGTWFAVWSAMSNAASAQTGNIMCAPLYPTLKMWDGHQWVPALQPVDTTPSRSDYRTSSVVTSDFTTTAVGSDVAVTGLAVTYVPPFNARATVKTRMRALTSAAGALTTKLKVSPAPYTSTANSAAYGVVEADCVHEDMGAGAARTFICEMTVDLIANTSYTFTGYVNNGTGAATTTVRFGTAVSTIELHAIPN